MEYIFKMPDEMLKECDLKGTVERYEYDTFSYDEGNNRPLKKGAWVYLPYGYDDTKKYDILYLLHGGGVTEDWWFKMFPDTVTILDNLFAKKIAKPCIIAAPSYYRGDVEEDAEYVTEHFHIELRKDIIPGIEKKYSTYASSDVSEDNLIKTRDHRAFAGLSLGSMTTYRAALYNNFDLFAWYGPFSGCCGPFGDHDKEIERICKTLKEGREKGLSLKYMFCANGDKDIAYDDQKDVMERTLPLCPELVPGQNYEFYVIPGGEHDMKAWQLHLYHALQVFFV